MTAPFIMREQYRCCGSLEGRIETVNGQDCVYCLACGSYKYNAPKSETGRAQRSLRSRPDIRPKVKARILLRDKASCVLCHRDDVRLDVGHLISVEDGRQLGLTDDELYNDENLAAMCAECNSGLSKTTVSLRFLVRLLQARLLLQGGAE